MSKIGLIIKREYITRVKKKSFIIMTILGPLLFAGVVVAMILMMKMDDDEFKKIAVIDETGLFNDNVLLNTEYIEFDFVSTEYFDPVAVKYDLTRAKKEFNGSDYYALLYIPHTAANTVKGQVQLISHKQTNLGLKMYITNSIEKRLKDVKLDLKAQDLGISDKDVQDILVAVNTNINVVTTVIDGEEERETSTQITMIIGYVCGLLIYMFVFMYGNLVMQGVIEEKSNRIIEVIVSSVKPFQLMMGKILGIALVGITQFMLWVILTFAFITIAQTALLDETDVAKLTQTMDVSGQLDVDSQLSDDNAVKFEEIFRSLSSINIPLILGLFLFYFIGGYLLYAALFAAIGSAVDNEADTQQFMLPISAPLMLGLIVMFYAINNPSGSLAYWFSIIPFTSPIVMLVRIPFGVPVVEVITSVVLLILTFILMTWVAAKIYRVGILMYGKKVTYKELWKWFRYKN
ncbi:MAG: ABC transporter permease [Bacteroidales bacterium]|jgi:ABC-2 type transport system permease protein|nr:ABC transporter permease [Bacteroidales bacterium]